MKTISYAITVKDELQELKVLLQKLRPWLRSDDEIVILFDAKNGDNDILTYLKSLNNDNQIRFFKDYFDNNFGDWKNKLTSFCTKQYIFQIDADEYPNQSLLQNLPDILEENDIDVYLVPRVNTVEGITDQHIQKWNWKVNSQGWINWPDYQWRLYKNSPEIKWKNKVHETLVGFKKYSLIPSYEELALYHPKEIERQERQNNFYSKLQ